MTLLKTLSENHQNLENLYIKDCHAAVREVNFAEVSFPKLKELVVPKLQHISAFITRLVFDVKQYH